MIRINIDKITKAEIEKMFLEDARKSDTGLIQVLKRPNVQKRLEAKHKKIYNKLYTATFPKEVNETAVERLLLADRATMKSYIAEFNGCYENKALSDELLNNVFKYDCYSKRKVTSEILRKLNVTVCPYCNRQYIITLKSGKARPQLDHYYPKSKYPYLALSLYNMIPSCSICNMAKSSLDTVSEPVLYPYDEEFDSNTVFQIKIKKEKASSNYVKVMQGVSNEFIIDLNAENASNTTEVHNQMKNLHLDELYSNHTDYVMDILKNHYVNTPERIDEIYTKFPEIFQSKEEVKNTVYLTDIRRESWGKRPLSKLTHDIEKQLENGKIKFE